MDLLSIILLAIGLAMDCFAVSIAQGMQGTKSRPMVMMAIMFGVFQGGMPLIAYYAGSLFAEFFTRWSPWIALILLSLIGGKMLIEAYKEKHETSTDCTDQTDTINPKGNSSVLTFWTMIVLAIATSIDALSIGVLFIPVPEVLWIAIAIIAMMSTMFAIVGFDLGKRLGKHLPFNANVLGGCILIAIGIKIFLEGMFE